MESGKKFAVPKVPKKHVKTSVIKLEPLSWSDLRDPEDRREEAHAQKASV